MPTPVMLSFQGQTFSQSGWAARLGMSAQSISRRLAKGWPIEKVLATDLPRYPRKHGSESPMWKGGRVKMGPDDYIGIFMPEHPRANGGGYVREHIVIAEKALGKPLPPLAVVHHVDEDQAHNENSNLVICQDARYHRILHGRLTILKAGGNPDQHKVCGGCHRLLVRSEFYSLKAATGGLCFYCKDCTELKNARAYAKRKVA